ncbi:MAG TPA: metallophosphoesterase family protein [Candidatus Polarisedimenticolaceae bacterium]|nr:metallophosphoesterase family protein [Candidatus Polarisedimenticolaceae bacterium]
MKGEAGAAVRRFGLLSDTHGLLRPEALHALQGAGHLVHAGDVGSREVLDALRARFPVTVVRGNVDRGGWAEALPLTDTVELAGLLVHVLHDLHEIDLDPAAAGIQVVVSGHTHRPLIRRQRGVLYVNPGSCGPRRFDLPVTVALLHVRPEGVDAELVPLRVESQDR